MFAPTPVPDWMFSSRIFVTSAATQSAITRCRFGRPQFLSSPPPAKATFVIAIGSE